MIRNLQFPRLQERAVRKVLAAGFVLVIVLLGLAAAVAVGQSRRIRRSVEQLIRDQLVISGLVHDVRLEEDVLVDLLRRVAGGDPALEDHRVLLEKLDLTRLQITQMLAERQESPNSALWRELDAQTRAFTDGVHSAFRGEDGRTRESMQMLFADHDHVLGLVDAIIAVSSRRLTEMEQQIDRETKDLGDNATVLLGLSLVVSVVGATFTMRFVGNSIRVMRWQTEELNRVSWHMLQTQEAAARRFSHELHDELGQSLAALRSNLGRQGTTSLDAVRKDCLELVDESIRNVRELSQLLRPVILDDLGLQAGLAWLADRSAERMRIEVTFGSDTEQRFPEQVETHLFRICQEALTNIARHSGATRASIRLRTGGGWIILTIEDDGQGLPGLMGGPPADGEAPPRIGLGMVGMRARARQLGGELHVTNAHPHGVRIRVEVPVPDGPEGQGQA